MLATKIKFVVSYVNKNIVMRKVILLAALFFISRTGHAQSYDGTVDYQKTKQATAILELPYPPGVEDAIKDKMKRMGYTGKESKGFITFKGVRDSSGKEMDYVVRVERKSRKEKDESVVYLFGQGANIDMAKIGEGSDMGFLKVKLNSMQPDIEAYNLEVQITDQEETVKKAEKKFDNLQDDISDNKKDQEKQKTEIENQKKVLDTLKSKRKG